MYQRNTRMWFVLAQTLLWFHLLILGSEATNREAPSVSFGTWKQKSKGELLPKRTFKSSLYAASSNENEEKNRQTNAPSSPLVVGLSVGLALVIGVIASLLCVRHSKRKPTLENTENNKQDIENNYIDEEEDSHPYRIVDLSTQIAYDSAGYTFLDASKKEEENPYQKLNASGTRDKMNIVSEKKENIDLAVIEAAEPVYYVLEA